MKDYEYEEENLDDFMKSAARILLEANNPERASIIESLKQHLSQIFPEKNDMENFFKTLNSVIFSKNDKNESQINNNKDVFVLYPIIFAFNPRTTSYFLDYYLSALQKTVSEENREKFTFLSEVFAEVIKAFFSDEKCNKYLIKKIFLLEPNRKKIIYEKMLNFCNNNIKTNKRLEQSFGCLLLTEFIEKCNLVKEDKNLDNLFKIISDYLDDRWFESKLDLLNCTISLIFTAQNKFKPYANVCLFRVLDYLTDKDWMKRKLSLNIVYTLVFYCREEVMAVKENIIEFLNMLKEDSNEEVKEICCQTLRYMDEIEKERSSISSSNITNTKNNYSNYNNNRIKNNNINNSKKNKLKLNKSYESERSARSNKSQNSKVNARRINMKEENVRQKLIQEKNEIEKIENDLLASKSINTNTNTGSNKSKKNEKVNEFSSIENAINLILEQLKSINETQDEFRQLLKDLKDSSIENYEKLNERIKKLEKHASKQKQKNAVVHNHSQSSNYKEEYKEPNSYREYKDKKISKPNVSFLKIEDKIKIDELKKKFAEGYYNEALLEASRSDRYLLKLLPLINKKIIPKIEIAILEDIISRLNKRIFILCMEEGREVINDVLVFYIQLIKSRINLKLVTQLSIKNALNFLRTKGINKLNDEDIKNIEIIISYLRD